MKTWVWILAAIAIALLFLGFTQNIREGFGTLTDAKCSDGTTPDPFLAPICANTNRAPVCPTGSGLYTLIKVGQQYSLKCVPNSLLYDGVFDPTKPMANPCKSDADAVGVSVPPSGAPGGPGVDVRKCVKLSSSSADVVDTSRTSGTTTGGTTGSTQGPNSGGGGDRRKQVFGPLFTSQGEGGVRGVDSSKTNKYPQLMGGDGGKASTRVDGAGIATPTLPFSIEPGDMELIPDPYRVSQQFSAASYSSKTEPVPFLTDFSAFQT